MFYKSGDASGAEQPRRSDSGYEASSMANHEEELYLVEGWIGRGAVGWRGFEVPGMLATGYGWEFVDSLSRYLLIGIVKADTVKKSRRNLCNILVHRYEIICIIHANMVALYAPQITSVPERLNKVGRSHLRHGQHSTTSCTEPSAQTLSLLSKPSRCFGYRDARQYT